MAEVEHPFEPVFDEHSRVLVLGTIPSPRSRELGFYYMHGQNRFWKILEALFDESVGTTADARRQFALRHNIALWDVLHSCDIEGASDASIKNARPNDLFQVLNKAPSRAIATTGTKAAQYFERYQQPALSDYPLLKLPSPSSANAKMRLPDLIEAYKPLLRYLR